MKMIDNYLELMVAPRFKQDSAGRRLYFPIGFGRGRIIPDEDRERALRRQCRRFIIALFLVVIPIMAGGIGVLQLKGVVNVAIGAVIGALSNVYVFWIARDLPKSDERQSYSGLLKVQLDRASWGFLFFGLITSVLILFVSAMSLSGSMPIDTDDPMMAWIGVIVFLPLTIFYGYGVLQKLRSPPAMV
jgi:hypothetical protein